MRLGVQKIGPRQQKNIARRFAGLHVRGDAKTRNAPGDVGRWSPSRTRFPELASSNLQSHVFRITSAAQTPSVFNEEMTRTDWADRQQITWDDLTFDVWTKGASDAEPIVLLHGFPESAAMWQPVATALVDAGYQIIAPDQRGYSPGARPQGAEAYATLSLVGDVTRLLDALELDSAHIVGHDWGAAVAWSLAAWHPERVRSLTAVSVPHLAAYNWSLREDADQRERASYIGLFRKPGKAETLLLADGARRLRAMFGDTLPPETVDAHVQGLRNPEALTAALNWYRAMTDELGELAAVTVPTTYVWSTADTALGRAGAERCGEFVDAPYEFVVLDGISHWIPEQAPRQLTAAILDRVRIK